MERWYSIHKWENASFFHHNMNFSVNSVNKIWLDWQPNKIEQPDNEKHYHPPLPKKNKKRINEFANFFPEVKKMSSTKTQEQDFVLYFKTKEYQG